ncbi:sugar phosphate isomerase/epimerase [soil metagenome]
MKLAFSTNAYTRFGLIEALQGIAAAGFSGVEILADVPHVYPDAMDAALALKVANELSRLNLAVSNVNANCSFGYWKHAPPEPYFEPSLISPNERYRNDRIGMILHTLEFAAEIGAKNISITSGRCLGGVPPARASELLRESLKPVLDRALALHVAVGIELEPGLYLEYVDELKDWIDLLGSKMFGANLDIGHSIVIGETIDHAVRTLAGRIWNMHVEDLPGRKHYHMVPGDGDFDWAALYNALKAIGYDRYLTVELYTQTADPQTAAARSFEFLSRIFAR